MNKIKFLLLIVLTLNIQFKIYAKGDLTRQNPVEIQVKMLGKSGEKHFFSPSNIRLETGVLYKIKLINKSSSKHYFSSPKFSDAIFTRKIQVVDKDKKIAEVKGHIKEVEVFPGFSVEWWLVPIKTGIFSDLNCRVKDQRINKKHSEMGMVGIINIK